MAASANDMSIVLSGGASNIDPNRSLGGDPSTAPIKSGQLNNLFDDVTPEETTEGAEDYRCLYVFNDGDTTIWSLKLWIDEDFTDGSGIELGIDSKNETQRVTVSGSVTSGNFILSYNGLDLEVEHDSDLETWVENFQKALDELVDEDDELVFRNVTVLGQNAGSQTVIFDVVFSSMDGKRSHPKLELVEDNLLPPSATIVITTPQLGAPINTIAPQINLETTPPGGVVFTAPTKEDPIIIPRLASEDGFPFWIRRTTEAETAAKENDGFRLRISAESLEPTA